MSFHKNLLPSNIQSTDNEYWEPSIAAALVEAWKKWGVDDAFKNIYARYVVSYLKPQWSAAETLEEHTDAVTCLTHFIVGNTHILASGSDDRPMRVWRCDAGTQQWRAAETLRGHTDAVMCLTHFSIGDTLMLASGSDDNTVRVWQVEPIRVLTCLHEE